MKFLSSQVEKIEKESFTISIVAFHFNHVFSSLSPPQLLHNSYLSSYPFLLVSSLFLHTSRHGRIVFLAHLKTVLTI